MPNLFNFIRFKLRRKTPDIFAMLIIYNKLRQDKIKIGF